jgi:hypothetical protein
MWVAISSFYFVCNGLSWQCGRGQLYLAMAAAPALGSNSAGAAHIVKRLSGEMKYGGEMKKAA